ncbi:MAG TPA: enolase C-terminal domain-like protein [Candidatus Baltobacteraceae bacterium]|nr:enolase C-terminal domain-like protein [Candidatus Baltobacteraceae bacterium]
MTVAPSLTLRSIGVRPVRVPLRRPVMTGAGLIESAPLVLIDLHTHEGVTGHAYVVCYVERLLAPVCRLLEESFALIQGVAVAPLDIAQTFERAYRIPGLRGLVSYALAGIDVACWDALARGAGLPLAAFLGAAPHAIPAYNSNGLGVADPSATGDEALALLAEGFDAVKLRLGYSTLEDDVRAVRSVKDAAGAGVPIMCDYNQALGVPDAVLRGKALDAEGLAWIEEPIAHDDYDGCAHVADSIATPIQLGENLIGSRDVLRAVQAHASDLLMFDLMRIRGVTGWLRAAAIAEAAGIDVSSHLFPEVSAHLLAATPTAHWLEYVDWANPILSEPLRVTGGRAQPSTGPGTGVSWNEDAVKAFAV